MTGTGSADATPSRLRYAFLGPAGTFTEAALRKVADPAEAEFVSAGSVLSAVAALRRGEVDRAVVPIENSVEGGVSATVDEIALGETLQILAEVHVPISFVLVGRPGVAIEDVRRVTTHPHAWAQVRGWAETALPGVEFTPAPSTAAGAGLVAQGDFDAAVCAPLVAEQTGLPVLAERIEDVPGAVTRFVLLSRPTTLPAPTGADKTTLVVPLPEDRPGALGQILAEFTTRGVNLSRIESRPTGEGRRRPGRGRPRGRGPLPLLRRGLPPGLPHGVDRRAAPGAAAGGRRGARGRGGRALPAHGPGRRARRDRRRRPPLRPRAAADDI